MLKKIKFTIILFIILFAFSILIGILEYFNQKVNNSALLNLNITKISIIKNLIFKVLTSNIFFITVFLIIIRLYNIHGIFQQFIVLFFIYVIMYLIITGLRGGHFFKFNYLSKYNLIKNLLFYLDIFLLPLFPIVTNKLINIKIHKTH